jgi:hypothetical protein
MYIFLNVSQTVEHCNNWIYGNWLLGGWDSRTGYRAPEVENWKLETG